MFYSSKFLSKNVKLVKPLQFPFSMSNSSQFSQFLSKFVPVLLVPGWCKFWFRVSAKCREFLIVSHFVGLNWHPNIQADRLFSPQSTYVLIWCPVCKSWLLKMMRMRFFLVHDDVHDITITHSIP